MALSLMPWLPDLSDLRGCCTTLCTANQHYISLLAWWQHGNAEQCRHLWIVIMTMLCMQLGQGSSGLTGTAADGISHHMSCQSCCMACCAGMTVSHVVAQHQCWWGVTVLCCEMQALH